MTQRKGKIYGAMFGSAIGDALGLPLRKKSYSQILSEKGSENMRSHNIFNEDLSQISADSQMSLFTANGLLFAVTRYCLYGVLGAGPECFIRDAYMEWFQAQTGTVDYKRWHLCWIRDIRALSYYRSPSKSTMKAIAEIANGTEMSVNSYGSGCLARTLPIPLLFRNGKDDAFSVDEVIRVAGEVAKITHRHPLGYLSCEVYTYMIFRILSDESVSAYDLYRFVSDGMKLIAKNNPEQEYEVEKLKRLIDKSVRLAFSDIDDKDIVGEIGEGWSAPQALAISLFFALRYCDDFEKAVTAAVWHSGNSPTIGAVVGGIVGCIAGEKGIPECAKNAVELNWLIRELAHDISIALPVSGFYDEPFYDTAEKRQWMLRYVEGMVLDEVPIPNSYLVDKEMKIYAGAFPEYAYSSGYVVPVGVLKDYAFLYDLTSPKERQRFSGQIHVGLQLVSVPLFYDKDIPSAQEMTRWVEDVLQHVSPLYHEDYEYFDGGGRIYIFCKNGRNRVNLFVACLYAYLWRDKYDNGDELYEDVLNKMDECTCKMSFAKGKGVILSEDYKQFLMRYTKMMASN